MVKMSLNVVVFYALMYFLEETSINILQFYGSEKQMDETENSEGDLASIVKRRRQLVKLAEEKLRKEKEEKLKKDKEEKLR